MRGALLLISILSLGVSARAFTLGDSQTLEALQAQAVRDSVVERGAEDAARRAAQAFEGSPFHIQTIAPLEFAAAPAEKPAPAAPPQRSPTDNYYFEGKSPVQGITIYTAKPDLTGGGRTGGDDPDQPYAKYGNYALIAGGLLAVAALAVGGPAGIGLGILGGIALGVGGLLTYLFKKK